MDAQLFVTHARMEASHWWFLARRRILNAVLEACVPPGKGRRVLTPVGKREQPHIILSITRWNAHLNRPGRVLHVVGRRGTPLLYVVGLRPYIPK